MPVDLLVQMLAAFLAEGETPYPLRRITQETARCPAVLALAVQLDATLQTWGGSRGWAVVARNSVRQCRSSREAADCPAGTFRIHLEMALASGMSTS
jgi:hypothetical protein